MENNQNGRCYIIFELNQQKKSSIKEDYLNDAVECILTAKEHLG